MSAVDPFTFDREVELARRTLIPTGPPLGLAPLVARMVNGDKAITIEDRGAAGVFLVHVPDAYAVSDPKHPGQQKTVQLDKIEVRIDSRTDAATRAADRVVWYDQYVTKFLAK